MFWEIIYKEFDKKKSWHIAKKCARKIALINARFDGKRAKNVQKIQNIIKKKQKIKKLIL